MAKPWVAEGADKTFSATKMLDRYRYGSHKPKDLIPNAEFESLEAEASLTAIEIKTESGDSGGRGAEQHGVWIAADFETVRAFIEWAAPIVYGDDVKPVDREALSEAIKTGDELLGDQLKWAATIGPMLRKAVA